MIMRRVEANRAVNNPIIKDSGFRAYNPRYTIIKKRGHQRCARGNGLKYEYFVNTVK
jgi:hypothetical protein